MRWWSWDLRGHELRDQNADLLEAYVHRVVEEDRQREVGILVAFEIAKDGIPVRRIMFDELPR